jgi:hypothetical protein
MTPARLGNLRGRSLLLNFNCKDAISRRIITPGPTLQDMLVGQSAGAHAFSHMLCQFPPLGLRSQPVLNFPIPILGNTCA